MLPEEGEELPSPAGIMGRETHGLVQFYESDRAFHFILQLVDEIPYLRDVASAEIQQAMGRFPVATCPAGLLVIALDMPRKVGVDHEPDVRLIDAHAEGNGRHDHGHLVAVECLLVPLPLLRGQAGVIGKRLDATRCKEVSGFHDRIPRGAINDPRLALMVLQEVDELTMDLRLGRDLVEEIGTIERCPHAMGVPEADLLNDVLLDLLCRRCRERRDRNSGKYPGKHGQRQVIRPEVVPPLGDTVRFIDGHERQAQSLQRLDELGQGEPLWRDVEELDRLRRDLAKHLRHLARTQGAVQELRGDAVLPRRIHLVLHERDKRADDHSRPGQKERRELIAQGLPAARGHDSEHVPLRKDGPDDVLLVRPEGLESEDRAEGFLERWIEGWSGHKGERACEVRGFRSSLDTLVNLF
jgi:hypothetical protein